MRRGWVWPISPAPPAPTPRPSVSAIFGNCVVLPEPVSPQTMTTWCVSIARAISSRRPETGNDSGKLMRGKGRGAMFGAGRACRVGTDVGAVTRRELSGTRLGVGRAGVVRLSAGRALPRWGRIVPFGAVPQ